jgi:predicted O-methyltransferase YrrM
MEHFYKDIPGYTNMDMQGELIKYLINKLNNTQKLKIAEIGVYMGRGTSLWGVELLNNNTEFEYYAIDHFNGSPEHIGSSNIPDYEKTLKYLEPILNNITIIKNNSTDAAQMFENDYFDIVYIDATHEYGYVKQDILTWLPKVKLGGYICGDDYHSSWPGVIQAVDELLTGVNIIGNTQWITKK